MSAIIPVQDVTTRQILYGARTTSFRYELLSHDPATGLDSLAGVLDGVQPGGKMSWSAAKSTKKDANLTVNDLAVARDGMTRIGDVNLVTTRIRPVLVVEGLPEMPLGVYVVVAAPESWSDTGRTFALELNDKAIVLAQDAVEESFTAPSDTPILSVVQSVVASAGEHIAVDASVTLTLSSPRVWEAGTSKLRIVNDLLEALNYNALWVDGLGAFRATPYVRPASRSIRYSMLNDDAGERLVRELSDGEESIYSPDWSRDRDTFGVPNKVITVQSAGGDDEPLTGLATNENPDSPFSYQARGNRWVVRVEESVETPDFSGSVDPVGDAEAFLDARADQLLIAASSPQSTVQVSCLPIPLELLEAVMFAHAPAGIDARHTVQRVELDLKFDGLMRLDLLQVVDV